MVFLICCVWHMQPLANLKTLDLQESLMLKEIPNLSKATNLKTLNLEGCESLVELPSSISNLHKLERLNMRDCKKLRVIPTNINLSSLEDVDMLGCSQLRKFPDISSNISSLYVANTKIEDVSSSVIGHWCGLHTLLIGSRSLERLTHVPESARYLDLSNSDIKRIPDCLISLPHLRDLIVRNCRKLVSLQSLPPSVWGLDASDCGSLKSVSFSVSMQVIVAHSKEYITLNHCKCVKSEKDAIRVSSIFNNPTRYITFRNCFSLDGEARRVIIQRWIYTSVLLPGKEVPAEFTHKAKGNAITISSGTFSASSRFKACLLFSSTEQVLFNTQIVCRLSIKGVLINELNYYSSPCLSLYHPLVTEHMLVFSGVMFQEHRCLEVDATTSKIQFEFSCGRNDEKISECGVQMIEEEGGIETSFSFNNPNKEVRFLNCLSLDEEARKAIIHRWVYKTLCLSGKQVPAEFTHRATRNSITMSMGTLSASSRFKACVLLSPNLEHTPELGYYIVCNLRSKGVLINELSYLSCHQLLTEHLLIYYGALFKESCLEVDATTSEIQFEFNCIGKSDKIIECGVQMLAEEGESSSSKWKEQSDGAVEVYEDESVVKNSKHTGWLKKRGLSKKKINMKE